MKNVKTVEKLFEDVSVSDVMMDFAGVGVIGGIIALAIFASPF
ncbi:hypothetical protein [Terrilactibacillus tamarindi]|nr:hypothetical protein [Terrilactibacillus tamarindi]